LRRLSVCVGLLAPVCLLIGANEAAADPQGPEIYCGINQTAYCSPAPSYPIVDYSAELQASNSTETLINVDGGVYQNGSPAAGLAGVTLRAPVVGVASTPPYTGGYWVVASDGGVFSFGGARFFGSLGGVHLDQPVVGIAANPRGNGYWLVSEDGGVFAFGGARFYGSLGGVHLDQPVVGMAATPDGEGYWLVSEDGGVFGFGDARFYGSLSRVHLDAPVVSIVPTLGGAGYWLVGQDGGVFSFGDAPFYGSFTDTVKAMGTNLVGGGAAYQAPAAAQVHEGLCVAAANGNVLCQP
jgi:hypothetical protein